MSRFLPFLLMKGRRAAGNEESRVWLGQQMSPGTYPYASAAESLQGSFSPSPADGTDQAAKGGPLSTAEALTVLKYILD